jgi:hypothetical protein
VNKPLVSNQGKPNQRPIKTKDQGQEKQKQNNRDGKDLFCSSVKP